MCRPHSQFRFDFVTWHRNPIFSIQYFGFLTGLRVRRFVGEWVKGQLSQKPAWSSWGEDPWDFSPSTRTAWPGFTGLPCSCPEAWIHLRVLQDRGIPQATKTRTIFPNLRCARWCLSGLTVQNHTALFASCFFLKRYGRGVFSCRCWTSYTSSRSHNQREIRFCSFACYLVLVKCTASTDW